MPASDIYDALLYPAEGGNLQLNVEDYEHEQIDGEQGGEIFSSAIAWRKQQQDETDIPYVYQLEPQHEEQGQDPVDQSSYEQEAHNIYTNHVHSEAYKNFMMGKQAVPFDNLDAFNKLTAGSDDSSIDLEMEDGTNALDLISRPVSRYYPRTKKWYHGHVVDLAYRPNLVNKIWFICLFIEDNNYDWFTYGEMLRILDEDPEPDIALYVSDVLDETKSELCSTVNNLNSQYVNDIIATRREMLMQPDAQHFVEAEKVELANMQKMGVLSREDLPRGKRPISSKFCYRRKRNPDGSISKYKSRLVAKGFTMVAGIDFTESFAPVATSTAFRLQMVLSMLHHCQVTTGDIDSAFLHGTLKEELYMKPPNGMEVSKENQQKVLRLHKPLYGTEQGAARWAAELNTTIKGLGYVALDASNCFWIKYITDQKWALLSYHVDDYTHTWNCKALDDELYKILNTKYGVTGHGPISYHLGMEIEYVPGQHVKISQRAYFDKILSRFGWDNMKPAMTPYETDKKLSAEDCPEHVDEKLRQMYQEMFGSLMFGAITSRPDLAFICSLLGKFLQNPGPAHLAAAKRAIRYVAGTRDHGLEYTNSSWEAPGLGPVADTRLVNYTDASWAGDIDSRLSSSGIITIMAGAPLSWNSSLQRIQALSSAESEYIAMGEGAKDVSYIRNLLKEMPFIKKINPTTMLIDSSAALAIAEKMGINSKTKHIALRYHFVRKLKEDGEIAPTKVGTKENLADILTKNATKEVFDTLLPFIVRRLN